MSVSSGYTPIGDMVAGKGAPRLTAASSGTLRASERQKEEV